jgi:hypothetical protein
MAEDPTLGEDAADLIATVQDLQYRLGRAESTVREEQDRLLEETELLRQELEEARRPWRKRTGRGPGGSAWSQIFYGGSNPNQDTIGAFVEAFELSRQDMARLSWAYAYGEEPPESESVDEARSSDGIDELVRDYGLTEDEARVFAFLVEAQCVYDELHDPGFHDESFRMAIRAAINVLAMRVVRRDHPDGWLTCEDRQEHRKDYRPP